MENTFNLEEKVEYKGSPYFIRKDYGNGKYDLSKTMITPLWAWEEMGIDASKIKKINNQP